MWIRLKESGLTQQGKSSDPRRAPWVCGHWPSERQLLSTPGWAAGSPGSSLACPPSPVDPRNLCSGWWSPPAHLSTCRAEPAWRPCRRRVWCAEHPAMGRKGRRQRPHAASRPWFCISCLGHQAGAWMHRVKLVSAWAWQIKWLFLV